MCRSLSLSLSPCVGRCVCLLLCLTLSTLCLCVSATQVTEYGEHTESSRLESAPSLRTRQRETERHRDRERGARSPSAGLSLSVPSLWLCGCCPCLTLVSLPAARLYTFPALGTRFRCVNRATVRTRVEMDSEKAVGSLSPLSLTHLTSHFSTPSLSVSHCRWVVSGGGGRWGGARGARVQAH